MACYGAATWHSWALTRLRFLAVGMSAAHGGPKFTVHGPKAGSMVDQVHRPSSRLGSCAPGAGLRCSTRPLRLCFFHSMLPRATCSPVGSCNGSGVQLRWGKVSPCHGDCNGGVGATDRAPRSLATTNDGSSTTGVRGWRGCSGIGRVCGVRERHNALAGMLGRSRGPPGPPVDLATVAVFRSHRWRRCGGYGLGGTS